MTPFGKRWAYHSYGRPLESEDEQPEFTLDNEIEFEEAVNVCKRDVAKLQKQSTISLCIGLILIEIRLLECLNLRLLMKLLFITQIFLLSGLQIKMRLQNSLASSAADVLGLMHERTGHLNK